MTYGFDDPKTTPTDRAEALASWLERQAAAIRERGVIGLKVDSAAATIEALSSQDVREYRPGREVALRIRYVRADIRKAGPNEREWPAMLPVDEIGDERALRTIVEFIRCPECGQVQQAARTQDEGAPFESYVHACENCGYVIMESEWENVENRTD